MSLPKDFSNPEEYFEECLKLFDEYKHLYNVSNVDILIHDVLDKIDLKTEDINVFDDEINLTEVNDEYLVDFFKKLKRLQVHYDDIAQNDLDYNIDVPVSPKKKHEIIHLAEEIKGICENVGCEVVIDFGSGLGYLDQLLFETSHYKVLGIECNDSHYVGAKKRQRKFHENSIENVKYIKHKIDGDSHEKIKVFVQDKFRDYQQFCITGLHACADLTIDAMDIFIKMDDAVAITIMPCCYHKIAEENGNFVNFPLSRILRENFKKYKGQENMKVPFLRLAAQPPNVDEKLQNLAFNLLSRAVLQLYAHKRNCKLKRNKRKAVKTKTLDNNFDTYVLEAMNGGFTLIENEHSLERNRTQNVTFNIEEINKLWNEITAKNMTKAGIYILLQNYLQPVIENFILYDRLIYLKENGINHCRFKKILNEKTSPRCLALIAHK